MVSARPTFTDCADILTVLKLSFETVMLYSPGFTPTKMYRPVSFVAVACESLVAVSVRVTVAPGMAA
jgi:hypothetical protein